MVIAVAVVTVVVALIRWNWPEEPPMTVEEEEAFERERGVAVNAGGNVVVATRDMGLEIPFVASRSPACCCRTLPAPCQPAVAASWHQ